MVFSSLEFIFGFIPIFFILYYIIPEKNPLVMQYRNSILFLGSIAFYSFGEPVYVLLILISICINYSLSLGIAYYQKRRYKNQWAKILFLIAIVFDVGILFFFKYEAFFAMNLNRLFEGIFPGAWWLYVPVLDMELPLGISFFTFQILSYVIDVYQGTCPAEKNLLRIGNYMILFPQLIAGPIISYPQLRDELKKRSFVSAQFELGIRTFILGCAMKVLLANTLAGLWLEMQRIGYESISTPLAWFGAVSYSLQIYYDFYGYSLMAIGLGQMLGITIPENFRDPYASCSVTEFWQRWHITLGLWLRKYIYIPLGGNRCSKGLLLRNLFVVWAFTGLWHGASWNYVIWGMVLFVFVVIEKFGLKGWLEKHRVVARIYLALLLPVTWMIFAIPDLQQLAIYLCRMVPVGRAPSVVYDSNVNPLDIIKLGKLYAPALLAGLALLIPSVRLKCWSVQKEKWGIGVLVILFVWSIFRLALGANNPFMYFQF